MTFNEYLQLPKEQRMPLFQSVINDMQDDATRKMYQSLPKTNKELIAVLDDTDAEYDE